MGRSGLLRRSEWVLVLYYAYAAGAALMLDGLGRIHAGIGALALGVNLVLVGAIVYGAWAAGLGRHPWIDGLRDFLPLPLMLLAYREMGWLATGTHRLDWETIWVGWDRMLLYEWGLKGAIEAGGVIGPVVLEVSYLMVYVVATFSVVWLVTHGKRARLDAFYHTALLGLVLSYVLFPFVPSEPPRTVFAGTDLPMVTPIRPFTLALLGGYGIHTSVFPSAHVSGAMSAALAMCRVLPEQTRVGRGLLILSALIAIATVYGRYHYAADAVAGLMVAGLAEWMGRRAFRGTGE